MNNESHKHETIRTPNRRKRGGRLMAIACLGLASLFTAGQAMAEHDNRRGPNHNNNHNQSHNHDRDRDTKVAVQVRTGQGSIFINNRGIDFRPPQPVAREVIQRVWVPPRIEERHVQVLVQKGHYVEKHTRVLVHAGHYVDKHTQVLVQRGYWTQHYVPPVYKTVVDRYGRCIQVLVKPGCHERVWVPDRYETRCEKVWIPDQYEMRCDKVWVPDRYETRCEQVQVAGYWKEVRTVVYDHAPQRPGFNIQVSRR